MSDTKIKTSNIGNLAVTHALLHTDMDLTSKTVQVAAPSSNTHPATKLYVDTEVANLIDSAPGTLDTLNELAAAINDDANFNATIASSIATKLPLSGGTLTGNLTLASTASGSSASPEFELRRDITGADANYIGQIKFTADNDADQNTVFAKITGKILDASDGTEDGIIEFAHKKAGSNNISARFRSDSLQLINGTNLTVAGTTELTGNVGIGTGSSVTNSTLNVNGGINITTGIIGYATNDSFTLNGRTQPHYGCNFTGSSGNPSGISGYYGISFAADGAEKMRIDSSGNLLVGKSVTTFNTAGTRISGTDGAHITRSAGAPLNLNRLSADGEVLGFYNDGVISGMLGVASNNIYLGSDDTGLYFNNGTNIIHSYNVTTKSGSTTDGTVDLGQSSIRFKKLHLASTAHVTHNADNAGAKLSFSSLHTANNTIEIHQFGQSHANAPAVNQIGVSNAEQHLHLVTDTTANVHAGTSTKGIFLRSGGNVGIGTTSPGEMLHIEATNPKIRLLNNSTGGSGLEWWNDYSGSDHINSSIEWNEGSANWEFKNYRADGQSGSPYGNIDFLNGSTTSPTLTLRIATNNNVAIGHGSPTSKLHVVDGNNNAKLGDLYGTSTMALEMSDNPTYPVGIEAYSDKMAWRMSGTHRLWANQAGDFYPAANKGSDLGLSGNYWNNVYADILRHDREYYTYLSGNIPSNSSWHSIITGLNGHAVFDIRVQMSDSGVHTAGIIRVCATYASGLTFKETSGGGWSSDIEARVSGSTYSFNIDLRHTTAAGNNPVYWRAKRIDG